VWSVLAWVQPAVAASGLVLAVMAWRGRWPRTWAWVQAAAVAASTVGLALYAGSEDDYRRDGVSRWDAYDAKAVTIAAILAGAVAATVLLLAAARNRPGLGGAAPLLSIGAAALILAAYVANTAN
jgi:hypothetical protein